MALFLNPWYMVFGGILISSPIIIHLINRMRFKRVRWAAMEFLLKSQKRNRRRLIIEQLILLLLRILLVLLAAFLVARFVGAALHQSGGTAHVVVVDDTPSMGDRWKEEGKDRDCFNVGRQLLGELVDNAQQASSAQDMKVFLLSDLKSPIFDARLDKNSREDLDQRLKKNADGQERKPGYVHVPPLEAVKRGGELLKADAAAQKVLTIVSDFRDSDWGSGAGAEELKKEIGELASAGVNVYFLDTAHPYRKDRSSSVNNHDNLAVTDLRSDTRVAAEGIDVEFTVVLHNFSAQPRQPNLHVYVDGKEDFRGSKQIMNIAPNARHEERFSLSFQKKHKGSDSEYVHVSAQIDVGAEGLTVDHVRDLVLEVRQRVPVLLVDGKGPANAKVERSDSQLLLTALESARSFQVESKGLEELEALELEANGRLRYLTVYFLNVPEIASEAVQQKLKRYAEAGGSVCFFLGPDVKPSFYNDVLHDKLDGLFPLLVDPQPVPSMGEEEKKKRRQEDEQPKLLFPDKKHPVVAGFLVPVTPLLRFLIIDRYFAPQPKSRWQPSAQKETTEVITMASRKAIGDYNTRGQALAKQALEIVRAQAADKENGKDYARYLPAAERHYRAVTVAAGSPYLGNLVKALENLLEEQAVDKDAERPGMPGLWALPRTRSIGQQLRDFKRSIEFGDPLLLVRRYGKGHTVAFLSSAGTASKWNEWGADGPAQDTYAPFIMDLQRYLISGGDDNNRLCSAAPANLKFAYDRAQYGPEMKVTFRPQPDLGGGRQAKPEEGAGRKEDVRTVQMKEDTDEKSPTRGKYLFEHHDARKPGVYTFEVLPLKRAAPADGGEGGPELEGVSYAFNIDAAAESDLHRAAGSRLEGASDSKAKAERGRVRLLAPGDSFEEFQNEQPDASKSPWLYLFILLVLVAEQAMAVHLSFHTRGATGADQATTATPAAGATTQAAA
jgi:hypothetical protein